jgi:hypothetical protein
MERPIDVMVMGLARLLLGTLLFAVFGERGFPHPRPLA